MRYARSRIERDRTDLAYRVYVTDTLRLLGEGKARSDRFYDRIRPKKAVDTRPANEIAREILAKAGIEVVENGSI